MVNSDEYTEEFQNDVSRISVEFGLRLLRKSRRTDIDFMNQLDVYSTRPRQWTSSVAVFPTKWVNEGDAKQRE